MHILCKIQRQTVANWYGMALPKTSIAGIGRAYTRFTGIGNKACMEI